MTRPRAWPRLAAVLFLPLALVACEDTINKLLGPENGEFTTVEDGVFRFYADDLDNVTDRRVFTWDNPRQMATIIHRNFVHHGSVLIMVRDANRVLVDSLFAEWEFENPTDEGAPGEWEVEFIFYGARGRVDTRLEPLEPDDSDVARGPVGLGAARAPVVEPR